MTLTWICCQGKYMLNIIWHFFQHHSQRNKLLSSSLSYINFKFIKLSSSINIKHTNKHIKVYNVIAQGIQNNSICLCSGILLFVHFAFVPSFLFIFSPEMMIMIGYIRTLYLKRIGYHVMLTTWQIYDGTYVHLKYIVDVKMSHCLVDMLLHNHNT